MTAFRSVLKVLPIVLTCIVLAASGCTPQAPAANSQAAMDTAVANIHATMTVQAQLALIVEGLHRTQTAMAPTATFTPTPTVVPPTLTPTITPPPGSTRTSSKDGMVEIYIPAGNFLWGTVSSAKVHPAEEMPQRSIYLDAYWIDKTPVTVTMYKICVQAGKCKDLSNFTDYGATYRNPAYANHPVTFVTWFDAVAYCQWAGGNLPTEAQWEKAARGEDGRLYPWGNNNPSYSMANFGHNFNDTTPVGTYPDFASAYGLLDMAGNVRHWVSDWFSDTALRDAPDRNPTGPETGTKKVLKGGSWYDEMYQLRSATRLSHEPDSGGANRGFRCVRDQ